MPSTVTVAKGDTLTKIAHSLRAESRADVDQTMIALYRANPSAFGGNINVLRQGAVLRVPGADDIAALNQKEAMGEVHRQMDAWRAGAGAAAIAADICGSSARPPAAPAPATAPAAEQRQRRATPRRCGIASRISKASSPNRSGSSTFVTPSSPSCSTSSACARLPAGTRRRRHSAAAAPRAAGRDTHSAGATQRRRHRLRPLPRRRLAPPDAARAATPTPPPAQPAAKKPVAPRRAASGSWLDWIEDNWQVPLGVLLAICSRSWLVAWRKRKNSSGGSMNDLGSVLDEPHVSDMNESAARLSAMRNSGNESIVVEESGQHPVPDFTAETGRFGDTGELRTASPEDTMSSESAVNLDQGDPMAEADFHMAYGLYDQAADLVRIALEREPERRDLRMKLLEIYFVWGNKDAFLQTAKDLARPAISAPAGEWDKIVIMGKQICPDEALFASSAGGGRGAGALVDLNLEGGENRVDIDLFGDPEGERSSSIDRMAKVNEDTASTDESPQLHASQDLDFALDAPERGAGDADARSRRTTSRRSNRS